MSKPPMNAAAAGQWIAFGWKTFARRPLVWVALSLIYLVSLYLLNLVPLIGAFIAALLTPALLGGLLYGAHELDAGRELLPVHFLQSFQDQSRLRQLLLLGLVPLAATLLQRLLLGPELPPMLALSAGLLLSLLTACVLLYALPLVMLEQQAATVAIPRSLRTCLQQPLAIALFLALTVVLLIVALLPLGLGVLVYLPVMVGAMYASYRQAL